MQSKTKLRGDVGWGFLKPYTMEQYNKMSFTSRTKNNAFYHSLGGMWLRSEMGFAS